MKTFEDYDRDNPEIWEKFETVALDLIARKVKHYGAKAIYEVIRYQTAIRGGKDFKINNNYTAGYARKFTSKYPKWSKFFEMRSIK
jgi:hypothetical protein